MVQDFGQQSFQLERTLPCESEEKVVDGKMAFEKLVVPRRQQVVEEKVIGIENTNLKSTLKNYTNSQIERIKVRDQIGRLERIKELDTINRDLNILVRKIKTKKYINLMYRVSILKIYLRKHSRFLMNDLKTKECVDRLENTNMKHLDTSKNRNEPLSMRMKLHLSYLRKTENATSNFTQGGVF